LVREIYRVTFDERLDRVQSNNPTGAAALSGAVLRPLANGIVESFIY
jgi:hypothetical protein